MQSVAGYHAHCKAISWVSCCTCEPMRFAYLVQLHWAAYRGILQDKRPFTTLGLGARLAVLVAVNMHKRSEGDDTTAAQQTYNTNFRFFLTEAQEHQEMRSGKVPKMLREMLAIGQIMHHRGPVSTSTVR